MALNIEVMNGIRGIRKATTSQQSEGLLLSTLKEDRKSTVDPAAKIAASVGLGRISTSTPPNLEAKIINEGTIKPSENQRGTNKVECYKCRIVAEVFSKSQSRVITLPQWVLVSISGRPFPQSDNCKTRYVVVPVQIFLKTQSTTQAAGSSIERVVQCFGRAGILYATLTEEIANMVCRP